jgi:hypothetical protein
VAVQVLQVHRVEMEPTILAVAGVVLQVRARLLVDLGVPVL